MPAADPERLRVIKTLPALIAYLRDELDWPVECSELDELTFDWNADQLSVSISQTRRLAGDVVRQLRPLTADQPWGIFIVEFADDSFHRGALREILRGLVANRRRDPSLPAWQHDNLLFICATQNYEQITFAHYRGEKAQKARLATFGWQCGSAYVRTLCEFNLPALRWPKDTADTAAWLKQWALAFDKEPLTREFFKRFDKTLEQIKTDIEQFQKLASAEAYSRAQLLLERMIFLYFLQNRGWLNRQRKYLIENFAAHQKKPNDFSYYEIFLEHLFWTLATAPGTGGDRLEGIPFLNGGLFDDDEFALTPVRKKNNPPLRIRNVTFKFVFNNLLEAFNFTVREDTPLNQDVAVDPEMLGKVFESIVLHAESEAEYNAPDKRKATGSYYTPRIVVHFICREALRLYLKGRLPSKEWDEKIRTLFSVDPSDGLDADGIGLLKASFKAKDGRVLLDILKPIKMCDPAVGSGAFPVGLLHELVNLCRLAETIANGFVDPARKEGSNWIHETKAGIVENCLYGVDIQQQAIEICRLRLWLSLIVDYDLGLDPFEADPAQFREAIKKISQLPNLEMNFHRGDSLLDTICGVNVRIETSRRFEQEYERIRKLGRELHKARKSERKRNLRVEIMKRRLDLTEKVLREETGDLKKKTSQLTLSIVSETAGETAKGRLIEQEITRLENAIAKVAADRKALDKIAARPLDSRFYPEIRKLEGAEFDAPFNFAWRIDYADIFNPRAEGASATLKGEFGLVNDSQKQQELTSRSRLPGGFDLILGNPPFVTARNPEKRELYRERWKRVCSGKYLLVCPFFDLSFGLLRPGGQLGFIVSNAFAKREFGKPLIEDFFPTVDLQKIVDCSGLMFPGHGTPTCIVFGRNQKPDENTAIRIAATLPGGGDLRTPPEESPLWKALEAHHDDPGYGDERITVADRTRKEMAKWPWNLDVGAASSSNVLRTEGSSMLRDFLSIDIGFDAITAANEIYGQTQDVFRRLGIPPKHILPMFNGDDIRNFSFDAPLSLLWPYDVKAKPILHHAVASFLVPWKLFLSERSQFHKTQIEAGLEWFEFREYHRKGHSPLTIAFPEIVTHSHFLVIDTPAAFVQTAPVVKMPPMASPASHHLLAGLLNSSAALFWLKQVCFNKGVGEDEERDRFVFAGGKVQQLPVPDAVADGLRGKRNALAEQLQALSQACWERGRQMPALAMKKLFEKPGEAYHDWNASLSGYVPPDPRLGKPFQSLEEMLSAFSNGWKIRETLRGEMIAMQEEMDWLVYQAYGLLPAGGSCSVMAADATERVPPLTREHRPFVLWQQAGGDFEKAVALIPSDWSKERRTLWRVRLEAIRDNEHIRRIEAPVYKRRWDEQWKVGNRWQCGPAAYDAELVDAFEWWLSEKAEWWLEKKKGGGPVDLAEWTAALWSDVRVQAAWGVVSEALKRLERRADFARYFTALIKDQSVPEDIPFAVPWDELEKLKIPASVKRIRGKLNVPRERFRITSSEQYIWAGLK